MSPVARYLLDIGIPYLLHILLYGGVFKLRNITCPITSLLVIAGAHILARIIPLPQFLYLIITIGAALVLITKYTNAKLYPDAIFISLGVEIGSIFAMDVLIAPLIY